MLAPFLRPFEAFFTRTVEFLWDFETLVLAKWKLKWKFEKWKALLAHMSVFIISKKPVLANRLWKLFAERLRTIFKLTLYYNTEIIWIKNLGEIALRTIIIDILCNLLLYHNEKTD
jgi:hypothetical protein